MSEEVDSQLRKCPKCGNKISQTHIRVEKDHMVRTRKCLKCKEYSIKTVEVLLDNYNSTIRKLNSIQEIMR